MRLRLIIVYMSKDDTGFRLYMPIDEKVNTSRSIYLSASLFQPRVLRQMRNYSSYA